jgi:alpha-beta hydrolase superfamily lysophospholipase
MEENVSFVTEDGVKIVGSYFEGVGERGALLLHMMPADRSSWHAFAERLQAEGFDVLAIDLRGHGESVRTREGQTLDFRDFSGEETADAIHDVEAALRFLEKKGIPLESIAICGASIGANLGIQAAADAPSIPALLLLSPGISYHGIESLPDAARLLNTQSVCIIAAKDDPNNKNVEAEAKEIFDALETEKQIKILDAGGHGTDMFEAHPELVDEAAAWLAAAMLT